MDDDTWGDVAELAAMHDEAASLEEMPIEEFNRRAAQEDL